MQQSQEAVIDTEINMQTPLGPALIERIAEGMFDVEYCPTGLMIADIFTNAGLGNAFVK